MSLTWRISSSHTAMGREGPKPGPARPSVLRAALAQPRPGGRDIVATVQAEQDGTSALLEPARSSSKVALGPGKAPVALHRAASLLYTYRFPLEGARGARRRRRPNFPPHRPGVAVVGETGVELSTAAGLRERPRPVAAEPADVARLKGTRMAQLVRRAVHQRNAAARTAEVHTEPQCSP